MQNVSFCVWNSSVQLNMSDFQWSRTQFEERWFHVLACLLRRRKQQQDTDTAITLGAESSGSLEDDEESDAYNDETTRNIAKEHKKPKLRRNFLDRLAEVMAHDISPSKKADDVCATGMLEYEDHVTVYVAKNGGLRDDGRILKHLQTWLRVLAVLGERHDIKKDYMWKELVIWNEPRLVYYRNSLRGLFHDIGITWSSADMSRPLIERKLAAVQKFCLEVSGAAIKNCVEEWTEIITTCYELRYEPGLESYLKTSINEGGIRAQENAAALRKSLAFLGRLRTA
jgi:hypothetical protein